ncbi:MAG: bifunctional phosphopantothenoylcysteine decarboxylase/phosphopantothenate--cysteine ligase CoaBC [Ignavibacteriaceae bacterium]|nr:bifunctional phosphopantothenoylcysteine decarboxylase/phosphopantothenate--cysteine ligase CoaBC [Ignavibacteriaceae bacterium]
MHADQLSGKKIILGVTGGIAAYKACWLTRELIKRGAEVKVVMTPSALQFVQPLTFSSLSKNEVVVNIFPDNQNNGTSMKTWHIDLVRWADLMIIAPCTVNTAAKIAAGISDNALLTVVLALRSPLLIAPAADIDMYENKITQKNFRTLEDMGYSIVKAEKGELASGLEGGGRMADINKIADAAEVILLGYKRDLHNKKVLVTAGPTNEDIDPVRFIGNRSSGKMGYNIAKAAYLRGAEVTLISGPVSESIYPEVKVISIRTAEEMKKAVDAEMVNNDILIMAAAVADYKPIKISDRKLKKEDNLDMIKLTQTEDILSTLKVSGKKVIGFALETDNETENARKKLKNKLLDMIVLNSLKDKNSGFEHNTNKITVIHKNGEQIDFPLESKFRAANRIISEILK